MRIKELRIEKNKTQSEIANCLGISRQVFANYENGINLPDPQMLIKISDYFNCSIDYLVERTDEFGLIKNENSLSKNESELLSLFKKLDTIKQNKVIGYCYALAN